MLVLVLFDYLEIFHRGIFDRFGNSYSACQDSLVADKQLNKKQHNSRDMVNIVKSADPSAGIGTTPSHPARESPRMILLSIGSSKLFQCFCVRRLTRRPD